MPLLLGLPSAPPGWPHLGRAGHTDSGDSREVAAAGEAGRRVGEGRGLPRVVRSWAAALQAHGAPHAELGAEGAGVTTGGLGMQDDQGGGHLHGVGEH